MTNSLTAELREDFGKGAARTLRREGRIPGVVYADGGDATSISLNPTALTDIFRKSRDRNTVVQLTVGDETFPVLVQDADRHPVSRELLHVDFLRVTEGKPIRRMVPVRTEGKPAGAAFGGRVRIIRRQLATLAPYDKIPQFHTVDVSPMVVGDMVKASEIPTADGVEVLIDNDFNVVSCYGKRGGAAK